MLLQVPLGLPPRSTDRCRSSEGYPPRAENGGGPRPAFGRARFGGRPLGDLRGLSNPAPTCNKQIPLFVQQGGIRAKQACMLMHCLVFKLNQQQNFPRCIAMTVRVLKVMHQVLELLWQNALPE